MDFNAHSQTEATLGQIIARLAAKHPELLARAAADVGWVASTARPPFVSLLDETRAAVPTECAAYHLGRSAQTLRVWSCKGCGPIKPIRVNGRLAWPVAEIKRLVWGAA